MLGYLPQIKLRFGAGFFLSQKLKPSKGQIIGYRAPSVRSLIGYDFRWDLIRGKRQSDNHSRNRPFLTQTERVRFSHQTYFLQSLSIRGKTKELK